MEGAPTTEVAEQKTRYGIPWETDPFEYQL